MMPIGTRTRLMTRPLGRVLVSISAPTGSGRATMSSRPLAMPSMRASFSSSRSCKAAVMPAVLAASMSLALAARIAGLSARIRRAASDSARFLASVEALRSATAASRARPPSSATMAAASSAGLVKAFIGRSSIALFDDEVVAVDHLVPAAEAQQALDLGTLAAGNAAGILGGIGHQPARQHAAQTVLHVDHVAAAELAVDTGDARGQQALAGRERAHGAVIDGEGACGLERALDPLLARRQGRGLGQEPAAARMAVDQVGQSAYSAAIGNRHAAARGHGDTAGDQLGDHAAVRELGGGTAAHRLDGGCDLADLRNEGGRGVAARIAS